MCWAGSKRVGHTDRGESERGAGEEERVSAIAPEEAIDVARRERPVSSGRLFATIRELRF